MAATEAPAKDVLGAADIPAALALSAEAGWNQDAADWALMIREGRAICLRNAEGTPVSSALALPAGDRLGWISMVLVTQPWRRKGLATRLVEDCIGWLEAAGRFPVLDATPDGAKVYERMGFEGIAGITRWQSDAPRPGPVSGVRAAEPGDMAMIHSLDEAVFGAARPRILADLAQRGPAFVAASGAGFALARPGRLALQVGPVSAPDDATAVTLLDAVLTTATGPVFIDVFDAKSRLASALEARGFTIQRPFTRMIRGRAAPFGDADRAFAAAGPELG